MTLMGSEAPDGVGGHRDNSRPGMTEIAGPPGPMRHGWQQADRALGRACAAAFGALLAGSVLAGPPYVTDDPEPTELGKWEVYSFGSGANFRHSATGEGGFDINYGGAKRFQLSAVVSLKCSQDAGHRLRAGVADTEIGGKYRFFHQQKGSWMPDVGLFPKLELPTATKGSGSHRVGFSIPFWAQKDFGPWSLFGGGGWTLNPGAGNRNYGFGGIASTRQVTRTLSLGGEIYRQTADAVDSRSITGLSVGATWQIAPDWSIIGSGGPLLEHRSRQGLYAFYLALEFHN